MKKPAAAAWSPRRSEEFYGFKRWGAGHFGVGADGAVEVYPEADSRSIRIMDVVDEAVAQGLKAPMVIRFQDLLRHRVTQLNQLFRKAIAEEDYAGRYRGVFPIKVNQLREVVEEIVDAGQAEFNTDELRFFRTIEQAEQGVSPNFLLVSSSLQYMEKPYGMLEALLAKRYPYFLLDRTMARPGLRDELYIQYVQPAIYRASYPVWFLNAQKIEELVQSHGYKLIERVDPYPGSTFGSPQKGWPYMSWYFEQVK